MIEYSEAHDLLVQFAQWATDHAPDLGAEDASGSRMAHIFLERRNPNTLPAICEDEPTEPLPTQETELPLEPGIVGATPEQIKEHEEGEIITTSLGLRLGQVSPPQMHLPITHPDFGEEK